MSTKLPELLSKSLSATLRAATGSSVVLTWESA
jgi:hypothetical protein